MKIPNTDKKWDELINSSEQWPRVSELLRDHAKQLEAAAKFWKNSHDNQVNLRRTLMDRPDLGDRARRIAELLDRIKLLEDNILNYYNDIYILIGRMGFDSLSYEQRKEFINELKEKYNYGK